MSLDPGMPRKVIRWAHDHGTVHNDCLASGKPCKSCEDIVMASFDHFYGHATDIGEVLALIATDFRRDQLADEQGEAS